MSLINFFIKRPLYSIVLNVGIVIVGLLCLKDIPIREYPKMDPPIFTISAIYPNASASLVESSVVAILEEFLENVEGVDNMTSYSQQAKAQVVLRMKDSIPVDLALLSIREALLKTRGKLPKEVTEPDIQKGLPDQARKPFMVISIANPSQDLVDITHFANRMVRAPFANIKGVSSAQIWGQSPVMFIELDPKEMYSYGINVNEITDVLETNNLVLASGMSPHADSVTFSTPPSTVKDFKKILLKEDQGKSIFLEDLSSISLKKDNNNLRVRVNGKSGVLLAIFKDQGSNPLEISNSVHNQLEALQKQLGKSYTFGVEIDEADFMRSSLGNIRNNIIQACAMILLILCLLSYNLRAVLILVIAIPISLIGMLTILAAFGFSLNTISLLAIALAIGLVVDDTIMVLENVHRNLEAGKPPLKAALEGTTEIGFVILTMTLAVASVYMPIFFIHQLVGKIFAEFAVVLIGAVILSSLVALTLAPLMCSRLLKPQEKLFLSQVGRWMRNIRTSYQDQLLYLQKSFFIVYSSVGVAISLIIFFAYSLPHELVPPEDRGIIGVRIPTIPDKSLNRLDEYAKKIETIFKQEIPETATTFTYVGEGGAMVEATLKPYSQRNRSSASIVSTLREKTKSLPFDVFPWSWSTSLPGLEYSDYAVSLVVTTSSNYKDLRDEMEKLRQKAAESGFFQDVYYDLRLTNTAYKISANSIAIAKAQVTPAQIAQTMSVFLSGTRNYDFLKDKVPYPIWLGTKNKAWDISTLYLTNADKKRISLAALVTLDPLAIPDRLFHFNQLRAATLNVNPKGGATLSKTMEQLTTIKDEVLPQGTLTHWGGEAKLDLESYKQMNWLFLMALVVIYGVLVLQFENFFDPLLIILTVPLACVGALAGMWFFYQSFNIYTIIGLITLVGLITKHGILLVAFANRKMAEGLSPNKAALEAALLRLRPILMTTATMILSVFPLVAATGAGSEGRRMIGTVLICGLVTGTLLTLFFLPTFYTWLKQWQRTGAHKI